MLQRTAAAIGNVMLGQYHRQVFFRHRYYTAIVAVNHRNRRAPVALARDAPVAKAEGGFLLAEAFGGEIGGDGIHARCELQAVVLATADRYAVSLHGVPILPGTCAVRVGTERNNLLDRQLIFFGESKIPLVMRWHTHHRAVAIRDEHVITNPNLNLLARQRVRDEEPRRDACFFFRRKLSLSGTTGLQRFNLCRQRVIALASTHRERMLRRNRYEGDAHDGVGARGEHVHLAVLNRLAACVSDVMRERKTHALRFADPVFLNGAQAIRPAGQLVQRCVEQLIGVLRDVHVVARNFAPFHQRA